METLRKSAKKIIFINILLLVFPWGLGLILIPGHLSRSLGLSSIYWRLLGAASLAGAVIYYFSYRFYQKKISFYVFVFGVIDNFLAGLVITVLFITGRAPFIAFLNTPLLFFFSYFFLDQACCYEKTRQEEKEPE